MGGLRLGQLHYAVCAIRNYLVVNRQFGRLWQWSTTDGTNMSCLLYDQTGQKFFFVLGDFI